MRVVSLFSGAGGMDLGFMQAGFKVVFANDIYKFAYETYKKNFGIAPILGDIRKIKKFPKAEVVIACNPCQGFSMIGKRNENDKRNMLYREIFRALCVIRPKYFVIENVKGLKLLYGGKFFRRMKNGFSRCGYRVFWKILDAKDYGVPQHRERIIIVGVRRDLKVEYEFPKKTHGPGLKPYFNLRQAIGRLKEPKAGEYYNRNNWSSFFMSRNRRASWNDASFTIQATAREVALHPSSPPMVKVRKDEFKFAGPLKKYRRLSIKECALIQSFPDDFKFSTGYIGSDYQLVGNAVPPRLAKHIAESIKRTERRRLAAHAAHKLCHTRRKKKAIRRKPSPLVRRQQKELALARRIRPLQAAYRRKVAAAN